MSQAMPPGPDFLRPLQPAGDGKAIASMVLGIVSLFTWLCPVIGFATSITGLVLGLKARKERPSGMATAGVVMCIIAIVLALINAAWGAYLGATGQHPFVNYMRQNGNGS